MSRATLHTFLCHWQKQEDMRSHNKMILHMPSLFKFGKEGVAQGSCLLVISQHLSAVLLLLEETNWQLMIFRLARCSRCS